MENKSDAKPTIIQKQIALPKAEKWENSFPILEDVQKV